MTSRSKKQQFHNFSLLNHNGVDVFSYPEDDGWWLAPFPKQKGTLFNADNLATSSRHAFVNEPDFQSIRNRAEARWINNGQSVRDISWRLKVFLWAFDLAIRSAQIDSAKLAVAEFGTGLGYMAEAMCAYLQTRKPIVDIFLFDSFAPGYPNPQGHQNTCGPRSFGYAAGSSDVRRHFAQYPHVSLVEGHLPGSFEKFEIEDRELVFVHIDLNNAISEDCVLRLLEKTTKHPYFVLFDDYGGFGGEKQAQVHEEFARRNAAELLPLPTGQALVFVKPRGAEINSDEFA